MPATLLAICSGCGYVGEPLPPLLNIPRAVEDLAAVQRGARIVVQFSLPQLTTEGVVIKPPIQWDLRAGEAGRGEFLVGDWAEGARSLGGVPAGNGRVRCETPAAPWIGKDIVLGVRVAGARGRPSAWSNLVTLSVIAPPGPPQDVKAEAVPEGIRITWSGAGPAYRVFRRGPADADFTLAGNTETREFIDRATAYGQTYRYMVQAIARSASGEVESDLSAPAEATPKDLFPPAVPTGLTAVATTTTVELAWERVTDPDLAAYRVYRAAAGGEFEKIGEIAETPSYTDRQIEAGKLYRYAVSAVDRAGNESRRSEPIQVMAQ